MVTPGGEPVLLRQMVLDGLQLKVRVHICSIVCELYLHVCLRSGRTRAPALGDPQKR